MATPQPPPSPGFSARRKGAKTLPKLPLSAFSPPNSGTSDRFPLPPSPSTVHPDIVIDAHIVGGDIAQWKSEAGEVLGGRIGGVVVSLQGKEHHEQENAIAALPSDPPVLSVLVPFTLSSPSPPTLPSTAPVSSKTNLAFTTTFIGDTTSSVESLTNLRAALEGARIVDIDIQSDVTASEPLWETFEELLTKATATLPKSTPVVLSNILPPPHNLDLPIVKLMNHPTYRAYQAHTAALSLFPDLYVKFLPPTWDAPTPSSPPPSGQHEESKEKKEWKRRIKMYLGPVLEAFGYQRIIFGSAPSSSSTSISSAGHWYEIARESLAELSVEQEAIDAVFSDNAKKVYGSS